ncbi:hypothetical protein DER44DRAFT_862142 [Fusarium oxysporum]|nr:hypothetical protein DER44DRAFT_862142 [Fusarium oxysporum]
MAMEKCKTTICIHPSNTGDSLAWDFFISLTSILAGFDLTVCVALPAIPAFQKHFEYEFDPVKEPGAFIIPVLWVTLIAGDIPAQTVGAVFGGPVADRIGREPPIYFCLVGNMAFTFLEMFGTGLEMIFAGSFLNGICYVFCFVLAPTYVSEEHLHRVQNMALIIVTLLGSGATRASMVRYDVYPYGIPFAL